MRSLAMKILGGVVAALMVFYFGYQGFRYFVSPYKTEVVYSTSVSNTVKVQALVLRDETLVEQEYSGVMSYLYEDATKVSKGMTVAEVYASEQDARNQQRMEELQAEIDMLKEAQNPGSSYSASAGALGDQITERIGSLLKLSRTGLVETVDSGKNDLLSLLNRKQIITAERENFDERIALLDEQLQTLENSSGERVDVVYSPLSGYFAAGTDGYEGLVDTATLTSMSFAELQQLFATSPTQASHAVGKVIENFRWYLIAQVNADQAEVLKRMGSIDVDLNISSRETVNFTIEATVESEDKSQAILVLSSDYISKETCGLRFREVELVLANYSGLKLPTTALRYSDAQQGVYVKDRATIRFKPVEVLYEEEGFVICREGSTTGELQLFDEVIVEGKELYDGKPV